MSLMLCQDMRAHVLALVDFTFLAGKRDYKQANKCNRMLEQGLFLLVLTKPDKIIIGYLNLISGMQIYKEMALRTCPTTLRPRISYTLSRVQCKVKLWDFLFKY